MSSTWPLNLTTATDGAITDKRKLDSRDKKIAPLVSKTFFFIFSNIYYDV